jgi:hypothetical protein
MKGRQIEEERNKDESEEKRKYKMQINVIVY